MPNSLSAIEITNNEIEKISKSLNPNKVVVVVAARCPVRNGKYFRSFLYFAAYYTNI